MPFFLLASVSSLSFLILKLAEEQSKRESRSQQQNNNGSSPVRLQQTYNAGMNEHGSY